MRISLKAVSAAIIVAGVAAAGAAVAVEASEVSLAYADGYVGTDGQFHAWASRSEAIQFRADHIDQYRAWRHDDPRHKNDK
ncbi:MAG: hypothetical protein J0I73_04255 [Sphingomonas sp.]|jgi:hypothetical protein|uniref:hypothetical protein n=1 Tax=Sphingomonas sp. TaxID=28214 RepID=UPI001AC6DF8A|nr:hypothetical protein [Sphingomonas sp.]MBN8847297.1 hypothetical protein [Sphingomonas sp.]